MIYLLVIILFFIPVLRYDLLAKTGGEKVWYYLELAVLVTVAGIRYRVGGDTLVYMSQFDEWPTLGELSYFDFELAEYRPLWYIFTAICKSICNSFFFLQFVHALIINSIFFRFFRKYSPQYYFTAIFCYVLGYYCYYNMEIMRASLCISIMLLIIPLYLKKNVLLYYIISIALLELHVSAIILIAIPLIDWFFSKVNIWIMFIIMLCIAVGFRVIDIVPIVSLLYGGNEVLTRSLEHYIEDNIPNVFGVINQFLKTVPIIIALFLNKKNGSPASDSTFEYIGMGACLMFAFAMTIGGFNRFVDYFIPFVIVFVVNVLYTTLQRDIHYSHISYLAMACMGVVLFFNVVWYYGNSHCEEYIGAHFYSRYFPYYSIFNQDTDLVREKYMEAVWVNQTVI